VERCRRRQTCVTRCVLLMCVPAVNYLSMNSAGVWPVGSASAQSPHNYVSALELHHKPFSDTQQPDFNQQSVETPHQPPVWNFIQEGSLILLCIRTSAISDCEVICRKVEQLLLREGNTLTIDPICAMTTFYRADSIWRLVRTVRCWNCLYTEVTTKKIYTDCTSEIHLRVITMSFITKLIPCAYWAIREQQQQQVLLKDEVDLTSESMCLEIGLLTSGIIYHNVV